MDSTAETGTRIEIPEGSLISMLSLVGSDVWVCRNALDWGAEASLRYHTVGGGRRAVDRLRTARREQWIVRTGRSVRPKFWRFSRTLSEP
jgi:hypothetical protein